MAKPNVPQTLQLDVKSSPMQLDVTSSPLYRRRVLANKDTKDNPSVSVDDILNELNNSENEVSDKTNVTTPVNFPKELKDETPIQVKQLSPQGKEITHVTVPNPIPKPARSNNGENEYGVILRPKNKDVNKNKSGPTSNIYQSLNSTIIHDYEELYMEDLSMSQVIEEQPPDFKPEFPPSSGIRERYFFFLRYKIFWSV